MTAVCVQFFLNVPDDEFDDVFKLANDAVGEAGIDMLRNAILSGFG